MCLIFRGPSSTAKICGNFQLYSIKCAKLICVTLKLSSLIATVPNPQELLTHSLTLPQVMMDEAQLAEQEALRQQLQQEQDLLQQFQEKQEAKLLNQHDRERRLQEEKVDNSRRDLDKQVHCVRTRQHSLISFHPPSPPLLFLPPSLPSLALPTVHVPPYLSLNLISPSLPSSSRKAQSYRTVAWRDSNTYRGSTSRSQGSLPRRTTATRYHSGARIITPWGSKHRLAQNTAKQAFRITCPLARRYCS